MADSREIQRNFFLYSIYTLFQKLALHWDIQKVQHAYFNTLLYYVHFINGLLIEATRYIKQAQLSFAYYTIFLST